MPDAVDNADSDVIGEKVKQIANAFWKRQESACLAFGAPTFAKASSFAEAMVERSAFSVPGDVGVPGRFSGRAQLPPGQAVTCLSYFHQCGGTTQPLLLMEVRCHVC
jgi:hypothetical protein